jgi:hypothetical protein
MAQTLGLGRTDPAKILGWYDGIVTAVQAEAAAAAGTAAPRSGRDPMDAPGRDTNAVTTVGSAGTAAFAQLAASLRQVIATQRASSLLAEVAGSLTEAEAISNAAVLMFGGIETTEGMIANARSRYPSPERTGTPRSSKIPRGSKSAALTPDGTWPSPTAPISASALIWPAWRRGLPSKL